MVCNGAEHWGTGCCSNPTIGLEGQPMATCSTSLAPFLVPPEISEVRNSGDRRNRVIPFIGKKREGESGTYYGKKSKRGKAKAAEEKGPRGVAAEEKNGQCALRSTVTNPV